jgi:hypothetical protein
MGIQYDSKHVHPLADCKRLKIQYDPWQSELTFIMVICDLGWPSSPLKSTKDNVES